MDIQLMIARIRPTSSYQWLGGQPGIEDSYASIGEWRDSTTTKPTLEELQAAWDAYLAEQAALNAANALKVTTETNAINNYKSLTDWVKTGTAADAETYINSQIWNGFTQAQANAYVDSTIVNITTANVNQINAQLGNIRTVFKSVISAVFAIKGLFVLVSKLLIYIRDLVIRFR